jgi:hypothetical protein
VTGDTTFGSLAVSNVAAGGNVTTAGNIDAYTVFNVNQTTANQTLTLPSPTNTTAGKIVYVNNVGTVEFIMNNDRVRTSSGRQFIWNGTAWSGVGDAGGQTVVSIRKSANSANSVNTTMATDTELQFNIGANETWVVQINYNYTTNANATPDIRVALGNTAASPVCTFSMIDFLRIKANLCT